MSELPEENSQSPTDSLSRPTELIPPDSPIRLSGFCNGGSGRMVHDSPPELAPNDSVECSMEEKMKADPPDCLTPTLEDCALSELLVKVADKDKHYVGREMLSQLPNVDERPPDEVPKLVGQTPTPVDCLSPFWSKSFPGHGDDISKDGPGGEKNKKDTSPKGGKKYPMTLSLADKRLFVINNGRVVEDGACIGRIAGAQDKDSKSCTRYFHEGMVMELVPGVKPAMKIVTDEPDAGSAMTEIPQQKRVSPVERCYVESGFCAFLVLYYDDPDNPRLEAMNSPDLHKKLKELEKEGRTPSDEHFTPLVNIAREPVAPSQDEYTTALYFTTATYTYFIHVDNKNLTLKKFNAGDKSPSANPRNNKQFRDLTPTSCMGCIKDNEGKRKDQVDGEATEVGKKMAVACKADSAEAESPTDSALEGSSNPRSSSSQLSSPEGSSISPSPQTKSNLHTNEKHDTSSCSEALDSGVDAN